MTGEFPSQRPVTHSFDVFFDLRLNKRLSKHSRRRWFETPLHSLWRHCHARVTHESHYAAYIAHSESLNSVKQFIFCWGSGGRFPVEFFIMRGFIFSCKYTVQGRCVPTGFRVVSSIPSTRWHPRVVRVCWSLRSITGNYPINMPWRVKTRMDSLNRVNSDAVLIRYGMFTLIPQQGAVSIRKTVLPGMAIPMLKIRRPNGRLIFNMEIAIRR